MALLVQSSGEPVWKIGEAQAEDQFMFHSGLAFPGNGRTDPQNETQILALL